MKKKWIIRSLIVLGSILLLLTTVLFVHIYMVTRPKGETHQNWQLSRIDFNNSLNDNEAAIAKKAIMEIEGVQHAYINKDHGTLVYAIETGSKPTSEVYAAFMQKGDFEAKPYVLKNGSNVEGCPVLDKNTLTYKVGTFFQNVIHDSKTN